MLCIDHQSLPGVVAADQSLSVLLLHRAGILTMQKVLLTAGPAAGPAGAVIVDRIAISAGNRVITASEVDLRLRLTAFQNGVEPEFTVPARKQAAERLIDQKLVE